MSRIMLEKKDFLSLPFFILLFFCYFTFFVLKLLKVVYSFLSKIFFWKKLFSLDEYQMKSFEKMDTLLSAILKFCTTIKFLFFIYLQSFTNLNLF